MLDFGRDVGRFTSDLATLVEGASLVVDVSQELLNFFSESENVKYSLISDISSLPYTQFDVISAV